MNNEQCQGLTTECTTGTGTGADPVTITTAAATAETGAAECITTQIGQWSLSVAAGWTCATCTNVTISNSSRHKTVVARIAEGPRCNFTGFCPLSTIFYKNTQIRLRLLQFAVSK